MLGLGRVEAGGKAFLYIDILPEKNGPFLINNESSFTKVLHFKIYIIVLLLIIFIIICELKKKILDYLT